MALYRAARNYRGSRKLVGGGRDTFLLYAGDEVEFDDATAKWIKHDSPGTLERIDSPKMPSPKRVDPPKKTKD